MGKEGKVFRIHSNHAALLDDWSDYSGADVKEIAEQIDTAEGDGSSLPSSIPSPFARIDLVKSAFEKVGNNNSAYSLQDDTNYHKLISDSLDIAEIFFNYSTHADALSIKEWSATDLQNLINSESPSHKLLGESLRLFMEQDHQYGFSNSDKLYILKYNHRVIGATNPSVMFFGAPDSHRIDVKIQFGEDKMLDNQYRSLNLRDINFIKYYVALVYSDLNQFEILKGYVDRVIGDITKSNPSLLNELVQIQQNAPAYFEQTTGLEPLNVDNTGHSPVFLLSNQKIQLFQHTNQIDFLTESSFVIKNERESLNGRPMVLPNSIFSDKKYRYAKGPWDSSTVLPEGYENTPLDKRKLPVENELYPWISANDIFEDILIQSDLEFNNVNFVTLGEEQFLIPIKSKLLEWFEISSIIEYLSTSKLAGGKIQVKLKIPVEGGFVPVERVYSDSNSSDKYKVTKLSRSASFGLGIYPFFQSQKNYFISLASQSAGSFDINPLKYNNGKLDITKISTTDRAESTDFSNKITYSKEFEVLEISSKTGSNLILPKFLEPRASGGEKLYCGVDFGTTNTHVEIKKGTTPSKPIEFSDSNIVGLLLEGKDPIGKTLNSNCSQTFIDNDFGKVNSDVKAPFRTALLENIVSNTNDKQIFEHQNIGFDYEKRAIKDYLSTKTNIKWTGNRGDVEIYIKELCHLLLVKSQLENIKPENVYVSWLYPTSMTTFEVSRLRDVWSEEFTKNFGNENIDERLVNFPESIAPFFHIINNEQMSFLGESSSVAVDIGGGTTDIMFYDYDTNHESESDNIRFISSIKFAGNSIFGKGAAKDNIELNGFYSKYSKALKDEISRADVKNLLDDFESLNKPEEFVNFIFSLENADKLNVGLTKLIKDDEHIKLSFLVMYSAIIFHVAELLKSKNVSTMPKNLVFSGTGSKSINFLGNKSDNYAQLSEVAKNIFECVLGIKFDYQIEIKVPTTPKEITSKGAIDIIAEDSNKFKDFNHIDKIEITKIGAEEDLNFNFLSTYADTKGDIRIELIESLKEKTSEFLNIFSQIHDEMNFKDRFGISLEALSKYHEILTKDIDHAIDLELKSKKDDEPISESLFFYSLNNNIPKLVYELSKIQ